MNGKKPGFDLQPAPRPRAQLTADQMQSVTEAAGHGFDRALNRSIQSPPDPASRPGQPVRPPQDVKAARPFPAASSPTIGERPDDALLKLKIPDALASALKHEAVRRKVTLRFLVLEALAAAGYAFNLSEIPEDGRRLR